MVMVAVPFFAATTMPGWSRGEVSRTRVRREVGRIGHGPQERNRAGCRQVVGSLRLLWRARGRCATEKRGSHRLVISLLSAGRRCVGTIRRDWRRSVVDWA